MRRSYLFASIIATAVLVLSAVAASAQTGQLRGTVQLVGSDGKPAPVMGAIIDVFRTDLASEYHTKTDKKGEWIFAGLPFVGTYIVAVSAPGAAPNATGGVKAGRDIPVDVILRAGDGRKLTRAEATAVAKGSGGSAGPGSTGGGGESAADKAKREELLKKNAEIEANNKKAENINKVVGDAFTAGNAARNAKNYDEAIRQYDIGLAADPEQSALLTNKADVLKSRGVDKYNSSIKLTPDDPVRKAAVESAQADFKAAAEAAGRAVEIVKKETPVTDPNDLKRQTSNKYVALTVRAEAMRLFVTKADPTQADAGAAAFEDYIAVETDPAKKTKAQFDLAQMLFDANAYDKSKAVYEKILAENPDNPDALANMGLIFFNFGAAKEGDGKKEEAKALYQQAANYLQRFVDKAPDDHKFKADAKAVLAEMKNQQNVQAEKTTTTPPRRKRP